MKGFIKPPKEITIIDRKLGKISIIVRDILYCESNKDSTWVNMVSGVRYDASGNLKEMTAKIDSANFYRLNNFYLINLDFLVEIISTKKDGVVRLGETAEVTVLIGKIRRLVAEIVKRYDDYVLCGKICDEEEMAAINKKSKVRTRRAKR